MPAPQLDRSSDSTTENVGHLKHIMALNWAMLSPDGKLLPLAGEKFFLTVERVELSMGPLSLATSAKWPLNASGTMYISNKRIAFVSNTATSLPDASGALELRTLSCPLRHFQDGRFVQPWLAANYYEAEVWPVTDGGLTEPQRIKIDFREGRGFEFTQAVEEVKTRFDENTNQAEPEALPLYEAQPSSGTGASPSPHPGTCNDLAAAASPSAEDIQVANCARVNEIEETEREEQERGLPPSYQP